MADQWVLPSSFVTWSDLAPASAERRLGVSVLTFAAATAVVLSLLSQRIALPNAVSTQLVLDVVGPLRQLPDIEPVIDRRDETTPPPEIPIEESLSEQPLAEPSRLDEASADQAGPDEGAGEIDPSDSSNNSAEAESPAVPGATVDWLALIPDAAATAVQNPPPEYAQFDGRPAGLEAAKLKYAPGPAPKPAVWDNVETDQLGRRILRSGNCYRVIEDDNPLRIDIFENFTQFFVFCDNEVKRGKELPWVQELRDKRGWEVDDDAGYLEQRQKR
ncbi:MAG: hypothetical protein AAGC71_01955 [Pseudomonadota bacterium]